MLDQFARHIHRFEEVPVEDPRRLLADQLALRLSEELMQHSQWNIHLTVPQHIFALMPLRHSSTIGRLKEALQSVDQRERRERESMDLINKFRKQTVRRLQTLEDRATAEAAEDILERAAFSADETDILADKLVLAVRDFLRKHSDRSTLAVSLSGGVDSMVIAKILTVLRRDRVTEPALEDLLAIHINYANRPESSLEADYVSWWCEQHGLRFFKRVVAEVTRGVTDRAVYECVPARVDRG